MKMKRYYLKVMTYTGMYEAEVIATSFSTTTTTNIPSGFYAFWDGTERVACYPIDRTIIHRIKEID